MDFFKFRKLDEENGAGDIGTPSLVAKYKTVTPGQTTSAPTRQPTRKGDKLSAKDEPKGQGVSESSVDQIDELKTSTLTRYGTKATQSLGRNPEKTDKRVKGIQTARYKVQQKTMKKEDVEQVSELSKKTLGSYIKKAAGSVSDKSYSSGEKPLNDPRGQRLDKEVEKRRANIGRATDRLTKEDLDEVKMSPQQQHDFDRYRVGAMSRKDYDAKYKKPRKSDIEVMHRKRKTNEDLDESADKGLAAKAEKSGISIGTLRKVYNRGMAAWNSGHRPGTTPQQWAMARVNSYIGKGKGTYHGADKDLREEVDGVKLLASSLRDPSSYDAIDQMMQTIAKKSGVSPKELRDGFVKKHGKSPDDYAKGFAEAAVPKDKESGLPKQYVAGLSASTAKARAAHFNKADKLSDSNPAAYKPAPGDAKAETKPSKHTLKYRAMFGESVAEACWDGYKQLGTKKKGDRMVPNCVPKNEESSPMIKPPKNEFSKKEEAFDYAKKNGGKVMKKTFTNSRTGMKSNSYVVRKEQTEVDESVSYRVDVEGLPTMYIASKSPSEVKMNLRKLLKRADMIKSVDRVMDADVRKAFRLKAQGKEETVEEGVMKNIKRAIKGIDAESRAGDEATKMMKAQQSGNPAAASKYNSRYKKLVALTKKEDYVSAAQRKAVWASRNEKGIKEKLDSSMGAGEYIKDFAKSDAPQFKGKTKKERQKMAVAAYLGAKDGD